MRVVLRRMIISTNFKKKSILICRNEHMDTKEGRRSKINWEIGIGIYTLLILYIKYMTNENLGFPGGSDGKESAFNAGDLGSIPGMGRSPGGEYCNPFQYSCLENPQGQRSLASYSPWGRRVRHDWVTKHSTHTENLLSSTGNSTQYSVVT